MKVIKLKKSITVILDDGTLLSNNNCTEELYNDILLNQEDEEKVRCLMIPEFCNKKEEINNKKEILSDLNNSKYLSSFGNSVYIKSISDLTVPEDLALAFYKAEKEDNLELVQTYLNFWTLVSLNPDSRVRTNLFWFLDKYGMTISKSGLFVAYRNVNLKSNGIEISTRLAKLISNEYVKIKFEDKENPSDYVIFKDIDNDNVNYYDILNKNDEILEFYPEKIVGSLDKLYSKLSDEELSPIYTDSYTGTFRIKLGKPVTIPRKKCDPSQENICSAGLHVAGKEWLNGNYFGDISLMVLINPTDVVSVPHYSDYGKMRVCTYYPVKILETDSDGNIINDELQDGFEDDFFNLITYQGKINNKDDSNYSIVIPEIPEISRNNIINRLDEIKKSLKKKCEY